MSTFLWRKQPSLNGAFFGRKSSVPPARTAQATFSKPVFSTNIAGPEKFKQRHGVGKSATV